MRVEPIVINPRYPRAPKWTNTRYVFKEEDRFVRRLPWQEQGLSETATGYGNKLTTVYVVKHNGRNKRVYCVCHSNVGTLFIMDGGQQVVVDFE